MKTVASRMAIEEKRNPRDLSLATNFLRKAWLAPDLWNQRKNIPKIERSVALRQFARRCEQFSSMLKAEENMVLYYFMCSDERLFPEFGSVNAYDEPSHINPVRLERGQKRLCEFQEVLRNLGNAAAHDFDVWPPPEYAPLPRKRNYRNAEIVFCIQVLLRCAKASFGKPIMDEVATTITVVLDLDKVVELEQVKSIWKAMKGGDSQEIPL